MRQHITKILRTQVAEKAATFTHHTADLQFMLKNFKSVAHCLCGHDFQNCMVAFDPRTESVRAPPQVKQPPRNQSHEHKTQLHPPTQVGPALCMEVNIIDHRFSQRRIAKYRRRGFSAYMPKGKIMAMPQLLRDSSYDRDRVLFYWNFNRDGSMPVR